MNSNAFQLHLATLPALDDILRDGAQRALQSAIEREVGEYIDRNGDHVDDRGRRLVVRNGHHPSRKIQSGAGAIEVKQPRVNDKRFDEDGKRVRFTSKILPPYLRKSKAIECLLKDQEELLAFYDFPAEHWQHLRTSNPIESTFATVRLRTYRTKGLGSREAGLAMAFKLARKAESRWRKLNGSDLVMCKCQKRSAFTGDSGAHCF